jgi:hypothetical protein
MEVYCGKKQDSTYVDTLSGPAAVVRNLKAIWKSNQVDRTKRRVIITDREYTSVSLAHRLLNMGFYTIGTVALNRLGFPNALKWAFKKPPKGMARGYYKLARNKKIPNMYATSWIDSKPVYFVSTGVSARRAVVDRKTRNGDVVKVACPDLVVKYNKHMSGVDSHDQLRLQR